MPGCCRRRDQRFALKARDVVAGGIEQRLQRDATMETAIFGGDDLAHAAARDFTLGDVVGGRDFGEVLHGRSRVWIRGAGR